jgi:hypothetical protein
MTQSLSHSSRRTHEREIYTNSLNENLNERDNKEYLEGVEGIVIKLVLNKWDEVVCTGFIWLRIGTRSGLW